MDSSARRRDPVEQALSDAKLTGRRQIDER